MVVTVESLFTSSCFFSLSLGINTILHFVIFLVTYDRDHCLLPNPSPLDCGFSSAHYFAFQVHRNYPRHLLGISGTSDPLVIIGLWDLWPLILSHRHYCIESHQTTFPQMQLNSAHCALSDLLSFSSSLNIGQ